MVLLLSYLEECEILGVGRHQDVDGVVLPPLPIPEADLHEAVHQRSPAHVGYDDITVIWARDIHVGCRAQRYDRMPPTTTCKCGHSAFVACILSLRPWIPPSH